jgi:hypothetical protein
MGCGCGKKSSGTKRVVKNSGSKTTDSKSDRRKKRMVSIKAMKNSTTSKT